MRNADYLLVTNECDSNKTFIKGVITVLVSSLVGAWRVLSPPDTKIHSVFSNTTSLTLDVLQF